MKKPPLPNIETRLPVWIDPQSPNAEKVERISIVANADALAILMAKHLDMDFDEAMNGLRALPDNLVPLLASREGWVHLSEAASIVAGRGSQYAIATSH